MNDKKSRALVGDGVGLWRERFTGRPNEETKGSTKIGGKVKMPHAPHTTHAGRHNTRHRQVRGFSRSGYGLGDPLGTVQYTILHFINGLIKSVS